MVITKKPWDAIAVDFGGPYPHGHSNIVAINKRTKYHAVAPSFSQTKVNLKAMFVIMEPLHSLKMTTDHQSNAKNF